MNNEILCQKISDGRLCLCLDKLEPIMELEQRYPCLLMSVFRHVFQREKENLNVHWRRQGGF